MTRLSNDAEDRSRLIHTGALLVGALSAIAGMLAFYLAYTGRARPAVAVAVFAVGPIAGSILTLLVWRGTEAFGRGLVNTLTAARGLPGKPGYSLQESLAARGRLREALESWLEHIKAHPRDLDARLALADLHRTDLGDPEGAEKGYQVVREMHPSPEQEFRLSNSLIDLYRATGQRDKELIELARFARRFHDTDAGRRAQAALERIRREHK
jgi:tetratricopeptide (TPR) repeat protein